MNEFPKITCKYCKAIFFNHILYDEHLRNIHHKIPIFECKKCPGKKFKGIDAFDRHLKYAHNVPILDIREDIKGMKKGFADDPYFQKLERQKLCGVCGSESIMFYKFYKGNNSNNCVFGGSCSKHVDEVKKMLSKELDKLY